MIKNESGQSTIELLVTLVFVFGFIFLFVRTAMNTTNHFMAHHYTFLASRIYLVADNNSKESTSSDRYAEAEARKFIEGSPLRAIGINGTVEFNGPGDSTHAVLAGAYFKFQSMMTLGKAIGGEKVLDLTSESFLLREPTRQDCLTRICDSFSMIGGSCTLHATLEDNGC